MSANRNRNRSIYIINEIKYVSKAVYLLLMVVVFLFLSMACTSTRKIEEPLPVYQKIESNLAGTGMNLEIHFTKGKAHNHPLMVIWTEDTTGKYIETLYVAESIGKGVFLHGDESTGKWLPGEIRRPAALPYWAHKRGVKAKDGLYIPTADDPMPDAVTGATPPGDFILNTRTSSVYPDVFKVLFEINQTWDWNEYWTNNKYPGNDEYKTSCQPALVYSATLHPRDAGSEVELKLIGHSHYSGENGNLFTDLSTITTAKEITRSVKVKWVK